MVFSGASYGRKEYQALCLRVSPPNMSLMADIELGDGRALEADWLLELSLQRGLTIALYLVTHWAQ